MALRPTRREPRQRSPALSHYLLVRKRARRKIPPHHRALGINARNSRHSRKSHPQRPRGRGHCPQRLQRRLARSPREFETLRREIVVFAFDLCITRRKNMATVAIVNDQDVITAEIFIAAPPARVFEAITDPAQMSRWWGQNNMYRIKQTAADLRVGGKESSVCEAADTTPFRIDTEYIELDP